MALSPDDLAVTTRTIIAELSAVDACGPLHWTPADQTRYVRLLVEQAIDEMARGDDALYDYLADCVMLAIQNMQDARLQMIEERLETLENPPPPTIKDLVIETAIMLGFELVVVGGAYVAVPAMISFAAARSLSRRTRALATAERRAIQHGDALASRISRFKANEAALRLNREQAARFPGPATRLAEEASAHDLADVEAEMQAAFSAVATSQAAWEAADRAMQAVTAGARSANFFSAQLKTFFEGVIGGTVVGRVAENLASDATTLITEHLPAEPPTSPVDGGEPPPRTYLTSSIAGRFLSEIRREQEAAARDWRALRFFIRFLPDARLLSDETAQELYLRARLFAARAPTTAGLLADREFLVLGMEAQLWLAWLQHTNALAHEDVPLFWIHPGFPPHGVDAGMVHEDKFVLEATFETSSDPEVGNVIRARGIAYPGIRVLNDGHADYLYHRFARSYFVHNAGASPAPPLRFDAARYDEVASMSPTTLIGFENLDRRDRIGEMKLLIILFFKKLVDDPAAIAEGIDLPGATSARTTLQELLELDKVDPVEEFLSLLPPESKVDAPDTSEERPVDVVLDAVALALADPTTEVRATAARLGAMVTDLDLAITQFPPLESFPDTPQGRLDKADADEFADSIRDLQTAVVAEEKHFDEIAAAFPELRDEFRRNYHDRIQRLTTWLPDAAFTGPLLPQ